MSALMIRHTIRQTIRPRWRLAALMLLAATLAPAAALADPEAFRVTGLGRGEPLSIRAEPDAAAEVVGEIRGRVLVFGCTNDTPSHTTWCRVRLGRTVGWARRRYLTPDRS